MGYYLYQMAFDGPIHFGDSSQGGGLERTSWEYPADRLFSSLCCELAQQGYQDRLAELVNLVKQGDFQISDLFPYQLGEKEELELFLPVPYTYVIRREQYKSLNMEEARRFSAIRKKTKQMSFCRISELSECCRCIRQGEMFHPQRQPELGETVINERVNCRGEQSLPYYVAGNVFAQGAGLYLLVKMPEEWEDFFSRLLQSLGMSGIGGKKSSGYGAFHLADDSLNLVETADFYQDTQILLEMLTEDSGKYMSISSLIPEEQDIDSLQEGSYRLGKSSGFTDGTKRNSVYMVKSGACLNKAAVGALMKVGVSEGHDILRYGKGMYVRLNL